MNLNIMVHKGENVVADREDTYKLQYEASARNMGIEIVKDLRILWIMNQINFLISAPEAYLKEHF